MTEEKWSKLAGHLEAEGPYGWGASCPPEERHRAMERTVRADGYATAVRRRNFLATVVTRWDNGRLHRVALEDEEWTRQWESGSRDDEDRRRHSETHHRARGFERDVPGERDRVRPHRARNPRKRRPSGSRTSPSSPAASYSEVRHRRPAQTVVPPAPRHLGTPSASGVSGPLRSTTVPWDGLRP